MGEANSDEHGLVAILGRCDGLEALDAAVMKLHGGDTRVVAVELEGGKAYHVQQGRDGGSGEVVFVSVFYLQQAELNVRILGTSFHGDGCRALADKIVDAGRISESERVPFGEALTGIGQASYSFYKYSLPKPNL